MIIEKKAQPQQPSRTQPLVVRQHKPQRPNDVRRHPPQHLALHQGFAHEAKLKMFEIAQAAVDQLGSGGGGAAGEVGLLAKVDREAAAGRIACNAATVNPTPDDRDIVGPVHPFSPPACLIRFLIAMTVSE